jgi:hypothetical protein
MKTYLKRATALLLVMAGLAALSGNKAFKLNANPQACATAFLQGAYGAGTTGLINTSGNPNDIRIRTFAPFAEAAYFLSMVMGISLVLRQWISPASSLR